MPKKSFPDNLYEIVFVNSAPVPMVNYTPFKSETTLRVRPTQQSAQVLANSIEEAIAQVVVEFPNAIIDSAKFVCKRVGAGKPRIHYREPDVN